MVGDFFWFQLISASFKFKHASRLARRRAVLPEKFWWFSPFRPQKFAKIASFSAKFRPFFAHFWPSFCQFLTPSTFFIAFLCGNVWKNCNFAIFFKKFPLWNIFIRNWKKLRNSGPKNSSTFYTIFRRFVNFNKNGWKKFEKFWIFGHFIGKNRPKLAIFLQKSWISPIFGYFDVQFRHRHVQKTHRPLTLKIRPFGEISPNMATLILPRTENHVSHVS